ncbi:MAG: hypothetical protein V4687_05835 [Bacteroidota bacterium]
MELEVNVVKIDGKPLEKLMDVIKSVVGTLYRPTSIRKEAEAYRIEPIAEAQSRALSIQNNGQIDVIDRTIKRLI